MSNVDLSQDPIRTEIQVRKQARPGWRPLVIAGFVTIACLGGLATISAVDAQGFGPGWMGPPGRGPGRGPGLGQTQMDPAMIQDRADRFVRHFAIEIDATAEQEQKLRAIMGGFVKEMLPLREMRRETADRARALLSAATIDRDAIEKFRAERIARIDAASKRLTQALADAAEVLTPAQRTKLAEHLAQRGPGAGPLGAPR